MLTADAPGTLPTAAGDHGVAPRRSRIDELDVVRGFALFGVLWMNFAQEGFSVPPGKVILLAPAFVEKSVGFVAEWLAHGKAQALFSMLFGLGFALFLRRASDDRVDGTLLYVRRLAFLLILGITHAFLLWAGDILNSYALVGFLLVLTRRWPTWLLLVGGIFLSVFGVAVVTGVTDLLFPHHPAILMDMDSNGMAGRFAAFQGGDYRAFVRANVGFWTAMATSPVIFPYLMWIMGRFMLGAWMFRQDWFHGISGHGLTTAPRHAAGLLAAGVLMSLPQPLMDATRWQASGIWLAVLQSDWRAAQVVLALGYAATLVVLYQSGRLRPLLTGLGDVGRMALTNYLCQSVIFFLFLDGFGLGLLPFVGPTFSLVSAISFFALQIALSRWWLSRYRFGPMEWLWRSFTYARWQPMASAIR